MELLILVTITGLLYFFLRSRGGKGASSRGRLAPASTRQGKRERVIALVLTAMVAAAILNMFVDGRSSDRSLTMVVPLLIGVLAFAYFYIRRKG